MKVDLPTATTRLEACHGLELSTVLRRKTVHGTKVEDQPMECQLPTMNVVVPNMETIIVQRRLVTTTTTTTTMEARVGKKLEMMIIMEARKEERRLEMMTTMMTMTMMDGSYLVPQVMNEC
jgi:hypothetical protein